MIKKLFSLSVVVLFSCVSIFPFGHGVAESVQTSAQHKAMIISSVFVQKLQDPQSPITYNDIQKLDSLLPLLHQKMIAQGNTQKALLIETLQKETEKILKEHQHLKYVTKPDVSTQPQTDVSITPWEELPSYSEADEAMLMLQNQFRTEGETFLEKAKQKQAMTTQTTIGIQTFSGSSADGYSVFDQLPIGNIALNISTDTQADVQKRLFSTIFSLGSSVDVKAKGFGEEEQTITAELGLDGEIRLHDNQAYLNINDGNIDITTNNQQLQEGGTMAKNILTDFFETYNDDTFIQLPLSSAESFGFFTPFSIEERQQVLHQMIDAITVFQQTPLLRFIHKEDGVYYGIPSVKICDILQEEREKNSCKENITKDMLKATDNKGFITLQKKDNQYVLSLSDRFVIEDLENFQETFAGVIDTTVLARNEEGLQTIDLSLEKNKDDHFKILYEKATSTFNFLFKETDNTFQITGVITEGTLSGVVDYTRESYGDRTNSIQADISLSTTPSGQIIHDHKLQLYDRGEKRVEVSIDQTTQNNETTRTINVPEKTQTLSEMADRIDTQGR